MMACSCVLCLRIKVAFGSATAFEQHAALHVLMRESSYMSSHLMYSLCIPATSADACSIWICCCPCPHVVLFLLVLLLLRLLLDPQHLLRLRLYPLYLLRQW
jgi:hypothetical protein